MKEVSFEEALATASMQSSKADLQVTIAETRMRWLESMGRHRVELSPQLGLVAALSPLAAISNLGVGLIGKQGAASPASILDAKADWFAARLERARQTQEKELQVVERYYNLLERQRLESVSCSATQTRSERRARMQADLREAKITKADLIRFDLASLEDENLCVSSKQDRQVAALLLASATGLESAGLAAKHQEPAAQRSHMQLDMQLQDSAKLVAIALSRQPARGAASTAPSAAEIRSLRVQVRALRPAGFWSVNNGGARELSAKATEAAREHILAKLDLMERETIEREIALRERVEQLASRFEAQRQHRKVMRRRVELTREQAEMASQRYEAGLENGVVFNEMEEVGRAALLAAQRLDWQSEGTLAALIAVCGLQSDAPAHQLALLTGSEANLASATAAPNAR